MAKFTLKHKQVALREADDIKFIPYTRHVDDTIVALEDGSLMRMYRVDGRPFETSDIADLNTWHNKLNIAWRSIGDDRVALWTHLVRTATDPILEGEFHSDFARTLQERYAERLKEKVLYHNEFYVTIIVRPSNMAGDQVTRLFAKRQPGAEIDDRALAIMADKCRDFESLLADTSPTPLSLYEHNGNLFSQPMEVLHFILTGDRIRVPLLNGRLGQALYTSRVIFGREAAEIRLPDKSHWLGMFGVREYVATTRTGQFNSLLTLDFPFVLTQSFAPLVKSVASERFTKKYKQMVSSDDAGVSQAMELLDGVDDLMANRFVLGEHHLSIAVMDDDKRRLLDRLSIARSAAADTGMVMAREDVALEAAFWAQLPGNFKMRARPAVINSRNFAALSPFYTFPAGRKSGTRNMNYTVQGDSSLQPTEISDNGEFTVLRYPGHADIPSIFAVDVDGTETIVPYDVREDFVVIHAVYRQLRLRRGNVVLCIYNEAPPRNDRGDRTGTVSNIVERKVKGQ